MTESRELATGYSLGNDMQHDAGVFLIEKLKIRPGMHVLDIGCGPGGLTSILAAHVGESGRVTGIDPSLERIILARERASPILSFHQGQAEDLSFFPTASLDIIFVNSTFHWVQDQPTALQEFARVLKPEGRLGISGGSGDFIGMHERIIKDVNAREQYREYPRTNDARFLKRRQLEQLLSDAGFDSSDMLVREVIKSSRDAEDMLQWLETSSSGKMYGSIPSSLQPNARSEMKEEWVKVMTDSGIHLQIELLVTVATKK